MDKRRRRHAYPRAALYISLSAIRRARSPRLLDLGRSIHAPILLPVVLILVAVGHSAGRDDAVWRLRDEVVLLLLGLRGWRGLVAEEAEGPVGEVEAAEDDNCCEDLFDQWVSEASIFVCVVRG